jgi:peroxiredoxin
MHMTLARLDTPVCEFGLRAPDFALRGVDESHWDLQGCRGEKGLLVMFISNHCPYVQAIRERLVRDTSELIGHGINSVAIMPNDTLGYPADSFENMQAVSSEYKFPFPYLIDSDQQAARVYGAVCTPDFFGYNSDLKLQYRGRLDSGGARPGMDKLPRELLEAMKQVAHSGRGPAQQVASMGCSIKWLKN